MLDYHVVCDKEMLHERLVEVNEKMWQMIDEKQDWNDIATYIEVFMIWKFGSSWLFTGRNFQNSLSCA